MTEPTTTFVRESSSTCEAVHTTDDGWGEVVARWLNAYEIPRAAQSQFLSALNENIAKQQHKPWLIAKPDGLAIVTPTQFAAYWEDVNPTEVQDEIWAERQRQLSLGYDNAHDDAHGVNHVLEEALNRLHLAYGGSAVEQRRQNLIKSAALIVAAIDTLDRANKIPEV